MRGQRSSRAWTLFLCLLALLVLLASSQSTGAQTSGPVLGGRLFSTGGSVEIEVLQASAALTSTLFLLEPEEVEIATNRDVGTRVTIGPYGSGEELIFGIRVGGQEYRMGPAERNPDGVIHASVEFLADGCAIVGFEDLFGGGDQDYNDNRFRFCGAIAPDPPPPPPPPPPPEVVPPTADAGDDQTVPEGSVVTLDGTRSKASNLVTQTYTTTADFAEGDSINVTADAPPDQLQLDDTTEAFDFIWIAASARGTVVKIDTQTGAVLGEYWSAPQNRAKDPSRTTVDKDGNVWVGNRAEASGIGGVAKGSAAHVGLAENGQCVDRNGNGTIDTSTGLGDIKPWPNSTGVDNDGGVETAADECVIGYVRTNGVNIRQVSIDADNHVWVGGAAQGGSPSMFNRVSPDGSIVRTINMRAPADTGESGVVVCCYGGLIDPAGVLWSSSGANQLVRIDPSKPNGHADLVRVTQLGRTSYGLGIDPDGFLWQSNWVFNTVQKISPEGAILGTFNTGGPANDRGVAVTADGDVWVANSGGASVSRLHNNGSFVAQIGVGVQPTGVAVDKAGKVWASNLTSSTASRIDPATNAVDLTVSLGSGAGPYNYSDMTGSTLTGAPDEGTWSVVYDSEEAGTDWAFLDWSEQVPAGAELTVSVASSADGVTFGPDVAVTDEEDIPDLADGRYLRVTVRFTRAPSGETPVLFDLTIAHAGTGANTLAYQWRLTEVGGPAVFLSSATSATPSFVAPDDAVYTFELTVTDSAGRTDTDEVTVTVENVAPALQVESTQGVAGSLTLVSASFTDAGWLDTHEGTIDWGDGTTTALRVTDGTGWGTSFGSHRYAAPGGYTVSLVLRDDDGGESTAATGTVDVAEAAALWANSSTASNGLDWPGSRNKVKGLVHSNRDVRIGGSDNATTGSFEYVNKFTNGGSRNTFAPPPVKVGSRPYPVTFDIAHYRPGGRAAVAAGAQYFNLTSECQSKGKVERNVQGTQLAEGLYYAPCNVVLNASNLVGTFTFVSTGTMSVSGSNDSLAQPFIDGLLLFTTSTSVDAIKLSGSNSGYSGFIHASRGRVALSGSDSRFFCGILADRVVLNGSGNEIVGGGCAQPAQDTGGTLLVPTIGLDLSADVADALPSEEIAYDLAVSNDGASLIVSGLVGAENVDDRSWSVAGFRWALETFDVATGTWQRLATVDPAASQGATLSVLPNAAPGVAYGPERFVGTAVASGGFASWSYEAVMPLAPEEVVDLLDPAVTGGIRVRFDLDFGDPSARVRQLFRFGNDFIQPLRALSGDITDANVTLLLPTGDPLQAGPADVPALARLAPGASVDLGETYTVEVPAPRGPDETDAGYLSRLLVLDDADLIGSSFALAQGGVGRLVAPLATATTTRHVPVASISTLGPVSVVAGTTGDYDLRLANLGSVTAGGLGVAARAAGSPLTVTGAPSSLVAGELATARTTYAAPGENPPADVTVTGEVTWTDGAGNAYGPVRSATTTPVLTPATLVASLSDALVTDVGGDGQVSPGDIVRYTLLVRNVGGVPTQNAVATLTPDANSPLVVGSVVAAAGTVVEGNTVGDTGVEVAWATIPGGATRQATFDVRVADPFPSTASRLQVQGQVSADGIDPVTTDDPALPGAADATRTTVVVPVPNLTAFLSGRLAVDRDGNGGASAGDTLRYTATVNSVGSLPVTGIGLTVPVPAGVSLVPGSVTTTAGTVAGLGVSVDIGTLASFVSAEVGFDLLIDDPLAPSVTQILVQGTVSSNELDDLATDDPGTFSVGDGTAIAIRSGSGDGGGGPGPPALPGPTVSGVSLTEGTILTEPATLSATLTPAAGTTVTGWTVSYRRADDTTLTQLASGTGTAVSATVDPTVMPNGAYLLVIRATSSDGGVTVSETSIVVDGQAKLGRFVTTFEDMNVGVAGLPVRVVRRYDSFDKSVGDFGVGWRAEVANFSISTNGPLGEGGWTMSICGPGLIFFPTCFSSTQPHYVTVTWPDGRTEIFDLTPARSSTFISGLTSAAFTGRPNTTSKLEAFDGGLYFSNGNMLGGFFGTDGIWDPTRFRLTDRFGTAYILDVNQGLLEMSDRSGNRVTVGRNGIQSTLGPGIAFTRDAAGRITRMTGPDGATLEYEYDTAGDLVAVTDPNDNVTRFTYGPGHYLQSVLDPLNRPTTTLEYHADGRLAAVVDGEGNRVEVESDPDARTETVTDAEQRLTTISSFDDRGNLTKIDRVFDGRTLTDTFTYDSRNLLLSRRDAAGNTSSATYSARGDITSFTDPTGAKVTIANDEFGYPTAWTDPEGHTTTYAYNPTGTVSKVTDPLGGEHTYTYDGAGNRTSHRDPEANTTAWTYDAAGRMTSERDPNGHTTGFAYDAQGRLLATTNALGKTVASTYDATGRVTSRTDELGNVTRWEYDELGRLVAEVDPEHGRVEWEYDLAGRVVSETDQLGEITTYGYDGNGRLTRMTAADGGITRYAYDGAGGLASVTDPLERAKQYTYDDADRLATERNPAGGVTRYEYDAAGRKTAVVNPLGHRTETEYDRLGRETSVTDPLGRVTRHEYDAAGRLVETTNPAGDPTTYAHDRAGRLLSITNAAGEESTFTYDPRGAVSSSRDPLGNATLFEYDAVGRTTAVVDPLGNRTRRAYDDAGRVLSVTTPEGRATTYAYDGRGLRTSVSDGLGTWVTAYDAAGRRTSVTDARGFITRYGHDPVGRVTSMEDPRGATVEFGYDLAGQQVRRTDANGEDWTSEFGPHGTVVESTDPLDRSTTRTFDQSGRMTSETDPRGVTVSNAYDDAGQLTEVASPDETVSYAYDELGARTRMTDDTGVTTWEYDPVGRITSVAAPQGTVGYQYDAAGRRTRMTQPEGAITYSYDAASRLTQLGAWNGTFQFGHDRDGHVTSVTGPGGITTTRAYDTAGRLTRVEHARPSGVVDFFQHTLDANGNRTAVTSTDGTESYVLDEAGQLVRVTYPGGGVTNYAYDDAGNRTSETVGAGPATSYTYDDASQLTGVGGQTFTYDAAGNLVSDGDASYTWDWAGRLASVDDGTDTTSYAYDADGRRVSAGAESFVWDRAAGLPAVVSDGAAGHVHGPEGLLSSAGRGALTDGLGSVRALADGGGAVVGTADYEAFGEVRQATGASSRFGFTGAQQDPTGLLFLNARYHSPNVGRFLSVDPVTPGGPGTVGFNPYAYAGNNPSTFTDPTGTLVETPVKPPPVRPPPVRPPPVRPPFRPPTTIPSPRPTPRGPGGRAGCGGAIGEYICLITLISLAAAPAVITLGDVIVEVIEQIAFGDGTAPQPNPNPAPDTGGGGGDEEDPPRDDDPPCDDGSVPPLSNDQKDALREQARDLWQEQTGRRANWDGRDVHHLVPLEWAHLFPGINPNSPSNLVSVPREIHHQITARWNAWRDQIRNGGGMVCADDVPDFEQMIRDEFGEHFGYLP